jgi:hypothetical protein
MSEIFGKQSQALFLPKYVRQSPIVRAIAVYNFNHRARRNYDNPGTPPFFSFDTQRLNCYQKPLTRLRRLRFPHLCVLSELSAVVPAHQRQARNVPFVNPGNYGTI